MRESTNSIKRLKNSNYWSLLLKLGTSKILVKLFSSCFLFEKLLSLYDWVKNVAVRYSEDRLLSNTKPGNYTS